MNTSEAVEPIVEWSGSYYVPQEPPGLSRSASPTRDGSVWLLQEHVAHSIALGSRTDSLFGVVSTSLYVISSSLTHVESRPVSGPPH